jgi:MFS-type transporter involved in bile tolerance (Atg22 family)
LIIASKTTGYSQTQAGNLGIGANLACLVGAILSAALADSIIRHRLKLLIVVLLLLGAACYAMFTVSFASPLWQEPLITTFNAPSRIWLWPTLAGLFMGACFPLFFELAAGSYSLSS